MLFFKALWRLVTGVRDGLWTRVAVLALCPLLRCAAAEESGVAVHTPEFENFGTMVADAGPGMVLYGPGASGDVDTIYLMFSNAKNSWFMVAVDTRTGRSRQHQAPGSERMVKSRCVGSDGKIYIGSLGGLLYVFDPTRHPTRPGLGIVNLGTVCRGEGYLFDLTSAPDGRLYMGSYPGGKLLCYDPVDGRFVDYGRAADDEKYTQFVAPYSGEYAYVEAGVKRHRVVRMNLETGAREEVALPQGFRDYPGHCRIWLGTDGRVQSYLAGVKTHAVIDGLQMQVIEPREATGMYGRLSVPEMTFAYDWEARRIRYTRAGGDSGAWTYEYTDAASPLFMLRAGPNRTLIGSSYLPLALFVFDPATREHVTHANPFPVAGGQTYAILPVSPTKVYAGAYGDADFIVYDTTLPWQTKNGKSAKSGTNPAHLGTLGDEQNRPYDMLLGPDGFVYVATTADYGKIGGALTKLDPKTNTWTVHRNCIPRQGIGALSRIARDERLIAGGSLSLASGHAPGSFGEPRLFLWDTTTDRVVYETPPPVGGMWYILQLVSRDDGVLVGTCGRDYKELYLFAFDPGRREFLFCRDISELTGGYIYETSVITPPYRGRMYFTTNGAIFTVDAQTLVVEKLAGYPGAARGGVVLENVDAAGRDAYFFITHTDLVAMFLPR